MRITDAEALVLEALWIRSPLDAPDLIETLAGPHGWTETTIKSLLGRLIHKEAVAPMRAGDSYSYRPMITREAFIAARRQDLLTRLFNGRAAPFVTYFSPREPLSVGDLVRLRRMVDEMAPA